MPLCSFGNTDGNAYKTALNAPEQGRYFNNPNPPLDCWLIGCEKKKNLGLLMRYLTAIQPTTGIILLGTIANIRISIRISIRIRIMMRIRIWRGEDKDLET